MNIHPFRPAMPSRRWLLALAWVKARAILAGFLHLDRAPGWLSAFVVPLGLWLCVVWGLAVVR